MRRESTRLAGVAGLLLAIGAPGASIAQEPRQPPPTTRADSLEARVAELERAVEALREEVRALREEGVGEGPRARERAAAEAAEAEPDAELEALRRAARQAAGEVAPAAEDTVPAASRTRSLQMLNPEISITGDVVGQFVAPDEGENRLSAVPREFEFSFQSALDPYTRTKIFFTRHEDFEIAGLEHGHEEEGEGHEGEDADHPGEEPGEEEGHEEGFEIEEAYLYWVGLPGGLGVKAGKFRQEIGLYNRWHTHALLEVERPLVTNRFLGEDGLIQTGLSLSSPSFQVGAATQTLWLEVARADNPLFEGGTELSWLGRWQSFFDLGAESYLQLGANGVLGGNDDAGLDSRLAGVDLLYRWAPAGRSRYRELILKGEWYWAEQDFLEEERSGSGGYAQANVRLDRRWIAGLRADYVDTFGEEPELFQLVPSITWWQSEWVRLRLQYNFLKPAGEDPGHTLLFQTVWSVGPHKHETY